jgi:hypothetical protein
MNVMPTKQHMGSAKMSEWLRDAAAGAGLVIFIGSVFALAALVPVLFGSA